MSRDKKLVLKKAIDVEKLRRNYSELRDYKSLIKLYEKKLPHIPDRNTEKFWDYKNKKYKITPVTDPMTFDKLNMIANFLCRRDKFSKVLNIGFGSAILENIMFKSKCLFNWYGIDISNDSVQKARKVFPECNFIRSDVKNIDLLNEKFDYILAIEVLEHIIPKNILGVLSKINQILATNGVFILSIPLNEGLPELLKRGLNPNAHVRIYTPDLIKAELDIAGFRIISEDIYIAFQKYYRIKTIICKYLMKNLRKPNNIVIFAQKK